MVEGFVWALTFTVLFYAWIPAVWSLNDTVKGPVFDGENPKLLVDIGLGATLGGIAGLYVSALLFTALARTDVHAATVLLGPSREELLARKVADSPRAGPASWTPPMPNAERRTPPHRT